MMEESRAGVDRRLCVECGVCIDSAICPVDAFEESRDDAARFKRPFGRLLAKHLESRGVGRESPYDVKTNDVTGRLPQRNVVMRLELNRPGGGLKYRDVLDMESAMQRQGWDAQIDSRSLNITDFRVAGKAMADQRILTCHFELELDPEDVPNVVRDAARFVGEHRLWVSINVAGMAETVERTLDFLKTSGLEAEPVAKVNLGLGRRSI